MPNENATAVNLTLPFQSEPWDSLPWKTEAGPGFLLPESHYWKKTPDWLSDSQRMALNRLSTCFSCELFIVFEEYLVRYLQLCKHELPKFSDFDFDQFLQEEIVHQKAFARLLNHLDPHLYPQGECRFLRWNEWDERIVVLAPRLTLFMMAMLFEQITIGMVPALDADAMPRSALVEAVMRLHAVEEKRHIALDLHVIRLAREQSSKISLFAQSCLVLPFLIYVDQRMALAWRSAISWFAKQENLDSNQTKHLRKRALSRSDYEGMRTFLKTVSLNPIPGIGILQFVINRLIQKYERLR